MPTLNIKPSHKTIKNYYVELEKYAQLGAQNEGTVRAAFQSLLQHYCGQSDLTLLCEKTHILPPDKGGKGVIDVSNPTVKSLIRLACHTDTGKQKIRKTICTPKQPRNLPQATHRKISSFNLRRMRCSTKAGSSTSTLTLPSRQTSCVCYRRSSDIRRRTSRHGIPQSLNLGKRCRNSVSNWQR